MLGYGFQYIVMAENLLPTELVLVLVVSNCNAVLKEEIATLRLNWVHSENRYHVVEGQSFRILVIELDVVVEREKDALLSMFAQHRILSAQALVWWQQQTGTSMANLKDLEHFDDVVRTFVESLPLEQRLAGLGPEQRLVGLDEAHAVLALPLPMLRALAPDYIKTLPLDIQDEVQRRLGSC